VWIEKKIVSPQKFMNLKNPDAPKDLGESFEGCLRKVQAVLGITFCLGRYKCSKRNSLLPTVLAL
jgi:hypothetical protein